MYTKGQLVYIYYKDLLTSLLGTKNIKYSRFGYVTDITSYTYKTETFCIYKIKTLNDTVFTIDQTKDFKICSHEELESIVDTLKTALTDKEYNSMLHVLELNK